mgnify:CR=1 FL=1
MTLLSQQVIGQDEVHHRFHHRHGPWQHAGVVTSFGGEGRRFPLVVDGLLLLADRGGGFESHANHNRLTVADAALNAAGIVGGCAQSTIVAGEEGIVVLAAFQLCSCLLYTSPSPRD